MRAATLSPADKGKSREDGEDYLTDIALGRMGENDREYKRESEQAANPERAAARRWR